MNNFDQAVGIVNSDVENINRWMTNHGLTLNPLKTQCIVIGSQHNLNGINYSNRVTVSGIPINYSKTVKYLGYTFNQNFGSSGHVSEIVRKVNFSINKISHCKRSIPAFIKQKIINGVVLPIFDYGSIIYHGHGIHGTKNDEKRISGCTEYMH